MKLNLKLWHVVVLVVLLSGPSVWAANTMWSALGTLTGANVASGDRIPLLDISDTTHGAGGTAKTITASELKNNYVHAAGSATAGSWPFFGSGTLLTTAEDGAIEQDADVFYLTTDAGNRGHIPVRHCIRADGTRTFTSNTTAQNIFNSPTNGRITLETGLYEVTGLLHIGTMSGTSGNGIINLLGGGSATVGAWLWSTHGQDAAIQAPGAVGGQFMNTAVCTTNCVTASTATAMGVRLNGTFEVTGAGTLQPQFTMTTASASVLAIGSYICFSRMGSTSLVSVGQWD